MNKKMNTILFILIGTIVNVVLVLFFAIGLLFLLGKLEPFLGEAIGTLIPLAFIGGVVLGLLVYQKLSKWIIIRFNLEDKLSPLFSSRYTKKK